MNYLIRLYCKGRRKNALQNIREHFAFFGIDTSDLSDFELEKGLVTAGALIATSGLTAKEAVDGLRKMADGMC